MCFLEFMKFEKNRKLFGFDEFEIFSKLKVAALPAITIILIIVIVIADRSTQSRKKNEATASVSETAAAVETVKTENNPDDYDFYAYGLQKDSVPEINELVNSYFKAKLEGDASKLYDIYGRTDTEGLAELKSALKEEKKLYRDFQNTSCYVAAGLNPDSYVVFISTEVLFKRAAVNAPMLTVAYIVKNDEGKYVIKDMSLLTEGEKKVVEKVSASKEVIELSNEIRKKLSEAVASDLGVSLAYQKFMESNSQEGVLNDESGEHHETVNLDDVEIWLEGDDSEEAAETSESATAEASKGTEAESR